MKVSHIVLMMALYLALCFQTATAVQSQSFESQFDALVTHGSYPSDVSPLLKAWGRNKLIAEVTKRLKSDPAFSENTNARGNAYKLLLALGIPYDRGMYSFGDERQIRALIQGLAPNSKFRGEIVGPIQFVTPRFRGDIALAIEPLLTSERDLSVMSAAVQTYGALGHPSLMGMKRLSELAFNPASTALLSKVRLDVPENMAGFDPILLKMFMTQRQSSMVDEAREIRIVAMMARLELGAFPSDIDRYYKLEPYGRYLAVSALWGELGRTKFKFDGVEAHQVNAMRALRDLTLSLDPKQVAKFPHSDMIYTPGGLYLYVFGVKENGAAFRRETARTWLAIQNLNGDPKELEEVKVMLTKVGIDPSTLNGQNDK